MSNDNSSDVTSLKSLVSFLSEQWKTAPLLAVFGVSFFGVPKLAPFVLVSGYYVGAYLDKNYRRRPFVKMLLKAAGSKADWSWMLRSILAAFERLFGTKHFGGKCIAATVIYSVLGFFILWIYFWGVQVIDALKPEEGSNHSARVITFGCLFFGSLIANYFNLFRIRKTLGYLISHNASLLQSALAFVLSLVIIFAIFLLVALFALLLPLVLWGTIGWPDLSTFIVKAKPKFGFDFSNQGFFGALGATWSFIVHALDLRQPWLNFSRGNIGAPFLYTLYLPSLWLAAALGALFLTRVHLGATWFLRLLFGFAHMRSAPYTHFLTNLGLILATIIVLDWYFFGGATPMRK